MISPKKSAFIELASRGNLIPVSYKIISDLDTPLSIYAKLRGSGAPSLCESFLLESVSSGQVLDRYSFIGACPKATIIQRGDEVSVQREGERVEKYRIDRNASGPGKVKDGLEVVEKMMAPYHYVDVSGLPAFVGGAIGFMSYEFIHDVEPSVPRPQHDEINSPVVYFLLVDEIIVFDRVEQTISIIVNAHIEGSKEGGETRNKAAEAYETAISRITSLISVLELPSPATQASAIRKPQYREFQYHSTEEKFLQNVERAKDYIHNGDVIQVVGSQRFSRTTKADALDIYRAVRYINPSPYMFLLEFSGITLVGASPETHVKCADRQVVIKPIAGTWRRGKTEDEDKALEKELLADPKERAEHVMLVDLARNDIGRVCEFGSVRVSELMVIERYSHVMHIVSQVEGRLSADKTPYDLMRATFPAGTLSGAPKIRAMQIISELENTARGPYGGCIGYFSFNGNLDSWITIRTAVLKERTVYVQAGGGWVYDSVPRNELLETVNKAKSMMRAVSLAEAFHPKGSIELAGAQGLEP